MKYYGHTEECSESLILTNVIISLCFCMPKFFGHSDHQKYVRLNETLYYTLNSQVASNAF